MKLELNHIQINIRVKKAQETLFKYDMALSEAKPLEELYGKVLMLDPTLQTISAFLNQIEKKEYPQLKKITFAVENQTKITEHLKSEFKIIKAAGGVVTKEDKILMIYRLKKWDLPKGKIESNEDKKEAAVREIEEECNVEVVLGKKICHTWHSYSVHKKRVLKKTYWYEMSCVNDELMKPQLEEGIEKVEWKTMQEVKVCTKDTYNTIKMVLKKYYNPTKTKEE